MNLALKLMNVIGFAANHIHNIYSSAMTLKITIADAMLQHSTEAMGLMKPYVILHTRDSEYKTRPSSGRNPSWGDSVLISQRQEDLTIEVFDTDRGIDDTIGHAFVKVRSLIGQPYVPYDAEVVTLMYQNMHAGELRLIVQYIEGKQHIGGLAPFQSKLMMAGYTQPMMTSQGFPSQGFTPQQGMIPTSMLGTQGNAPIPQTSNLSNPVPQQMPFGQPMGSGIYNMPPPQGSLIRQQQTITSRGPMMPTSSQVIDPRATIFNPTTQPIMAGGSLSNPSMFGSYNAMNQMNAMGQSQTGLAAGNVTIAGGTPSMINQTFGTRRMPIFKTGCPSLNWFSILDGEGKPTECLPARLI